MYANVISGGQNVFNNIVNYSRGDEVKEYLKDNLNRIREKVGDIGMSFIDRAQSIYDTAYSFEEDERIREAIDIIGTSVDGDAIIEYTEETILEANETVRRYIMADEELYRLYQTESISGYNDFFYEPDMVFNLEDRRSYQNVMNGRQQVDSNGNEFYIQYYGDDAMTIEEQDAILNTRHVVRDLLSRNIDATDV